MIVLAAVLAVVLAFVFWQHVRTTDRFVQALEDQATQHRAEVQTLLQRVQAPQLAIAEHDATVTPTPENVYPLTDDEQAQAQDARLAAEAALAQIARHEAELEAESWIASP